MKRELIKKDLIKSRLATNHGGWMYCDNCQQNIGYLCYVTYDKFTLNYECSCGCNGSIKLVFSDDINTMKSKKEFIMCKNRCCCPEDESPLFTILEKKVKTYDVEVLCHNCKKLYCKEKK